jgi:DNA-directed RNA polymerase subunit RPC12/RpoP
MENVKDTKEAKTRVVLINQIIDRAAELGIMYSSRLSHSMDINYAVQVFDIDLKAWLDSTNNDFIHDYVGIYKNIDRDAISSKHFASKNDFGTFVPRFARNENNLIKDCYESYKNLLKLEKKIHKSAVLFQTAAITLAEMQQKYEDGIEVKRQGDDADDEILCPECGYSLARNDEEEELRPKHCPECGIKLIY